MKKRPVTVTMFGWLLVVVGAAAFAFHLNELKPQHAFQVGNIWIFVVEVVAIVAGVFVLRGHNWARWLALVWVASHVVFSFANSMAQMAIHSIILLLFAYSLFRPEAKAYFRQ